jgi:hypothetical protein
MSLVRSFDSRLNRIEELLNGRCPVGPPIMAPQDRWEFAHSLAGEILDQDSGSTRERVFLKRFDELADLDRLGIRNYIRGLCSFGCFEPESEARVLEEWWAIQR